MTIEDDGVGIGETPSDGGSHIGIENVRSRLEAMCRGTLTIQSSPNAGTTVVLHIPKGGAEHELSSGG